MTCDTSRRFGYNHRMTTFYQSSPWRRARARVLATFPRCQVPGCTLPATQVDHIRSLASGGAALDPANLSAMCQSCHSRKTAAVDGSFGRRGSGVAPSGKRGCDASGNPVDPGHRWNRLGGHLTGVAFVGYPCSPPVARVACTAFLGAPRGKGVSKSREIEGGLTDGVVRSQVAQISQEK